MQLKDFVSQTLKEIVEGVIEAQKTTSVNEGHINPEIDRSSVDPTMRIAANGRLIESVEFDVAVTVDEGTGTKGGIGIFIGALALGSQGESSNKNSSINRVKFTVPILLPRAN